MTLEMGLWIDMHSEFDNTCVNSSWCLQGKGEDHHHWNTPPSSPHTCQYGDRALAKKRKDTVSHAAALDSLQ